MALGLYTALPGFAGWDDGCAGLLAPALPVVGLILGALWAALTALARAVLPEPLAACILVLSLPAMTGFLHLDGYMDVADALLSSRSREEKLRILKDSHVAPSPSSRWPVCSCWKPRPPCPWERRRFGRWCFCPSCRVRRLRWR